MKKLLSGVFCALTLLLIIGAVVFVRRDLSFSSGIYLFADNGNHLIILDNSPVVMSNRSRDPLLFDGLSSGVRITILHDGIQESYPGSTGVYHLHRSGNGQLSDVPQEVFEQLIQLDWWTGVYPVDEAKLSAAPLTFSSCWANWCEDPALHRAALNTRLLEMDDYSHLPVYRVDSPEDLVRFSAQFGQILDLTHGYDEVSSFSEATDNMDADYFAHYCTLITYVTAGSTSYRFGVNSISHSGDQLRVHVQQINDPEFGDCAMAGWLLFVSLPKELAAEIDVFDADLNAFSD